MITLQQLEANRRLVLKKKLASVQAFEFKNLRYKEHQAATDAYEAACDASDAAEEEYDEVRKKARELANSFLDTPQPEDDTQLTMVTGAEFPKCLEDEDIPF